MLACSGSFQLLSKSNLGEERVSVTYTSRLPSITEGSQGMWELEAEIIGEHCLLAHSVAHAQLAFLCGPGAPEQGMELPMMSWVF